jgi:hypothetical protein
MNKNLKAILVLKKLRNEQNEEYNSEQKTTSTKRTNLFSIRNGGMGGKRTTAIWKR